MMLTPQVSLVDVCVTQKSKSLESEWLQLKMASGQELVVVRVT